MNLFRSGEHITRWLNGRAPGVTIAVKVLNDLALNWWGDRVDPLWRPHTRDQNQAILTDLGLIGEFWQLAGR